MNPTQEVSVLVSDLEIIKAALNSARHHSIVLDLSEQYRKMSGRPQSSPMTKSLEGAQDKAEAYLRAAQEAADDE